MEFYQSIAKYYDQIFDLSQNKVNFVKHFIEQNNGKLLDIGCSTGKMDKDIISDFSHISAIDLDKAMIEYAKQYYHDPMIDFYAMNMLNIGDKFTKNSFNIITCFGNTLVHLNTLSEIQSLLTQIFNLLKNDGSFLCQIINYDRILENEITFLPTIENENLKFTRNYKYQKNRHKIKFSTVLSVGSDNVNIKNQIELLPLVKNDIVKMLQIAGFKKIDLFSNWDLKPFNIEATPLILRSVKRLKKTSESFSFIRRIETNRWNINERKNNLT